jgi:hypothetical protein
MLTIVMINRWKKRLFFPFPCPPLDCVTVGHSFSFVSIPHGPVEFVASKHFHFCYKSCLLLLVDCAYLSEHHIHLSRPLLSSHLLSWTDYSHISVVCLVMSCGIPFLLVCTVPQQLIFCLVRLSDKSGEEKKLSMYSEFSCPCTVFFFFYQVLYCSMCCHICSGSCPVHP